MAPPLVLSTRQALTALDASSAQAVIPVDLRSEEAFASGHIPGAVRLDAALLNRKHGSVAGLLPTLAVVNDFLTEAGLNQGDHVLAYDAGASTEAARLIWVLHAYGYVHTSWLDGGFAAWQADQLPASTDITIRAPGSLSVTFSGQNVVSTEELMKELADANTSATTLPGTDTRSQAGDQANALSGASILDVRSTAEFEGSDVRSARGGHVPGATHLEWTRVFGPDGRLLHETQLRELFSETLEAGGKEGIGNTPVIVYCQSHQRSAVTYVVLKHLGIQKVRAIDGAWSSWGNREDTPVETGIQQRTPTTPISDELA